MNKLNKQNPVRALFSDIKLPWMLLLIMLALGVCRAYLEVESITLTASIIDSSQSIKSEKLIKYIVYILCTGILTVSTTLINGLVDNKISLGVRIKLWNKVMRLPTRYYDGESGEKLVSRITTDTTEVSKYFSIIVSYVISIYSAVISVVKMFKIDTQLSSYLMFIVPISVLVSYLIGSLSYKVGFRTRSSFAATTGYLAERVRNFWLIKAAGTETEEIGQGADKFRTQFKADILNVFSSSAFNTTIILSGMVTTLIVFAVGAPKVSTGEMTTGFVIAFYTLAGMMGARFMSLVSGYVNFMRTNGSVKKVVEILQSEEEKSEGIELDVFDADIILKNATFGYKKDMPILKDVNCIIPKQKCTAIIGANGAGKTTIFKLLERMYDVDTGEVLFGDTNVKEFNLRSWRKSFALVAQDRPLMQGTVRENIVYGVEHDVSEEELIEVAQLARAYDFVKDLPQGFDTEVGPGGSNFSGGQRQCIAIARALMRNPDYLLLDEATSNLDAMCESAVSEAIKNLMKGRTVIMIAHNPSAIKNADNVVILNDGQITESGSPEQLLKTSEQFKQFVAQKV